MVGLRHGAGRESPCPSLNKRVVSVICRRLGMASATSKVIERCDAMSQPCRRDVGKGSNTPISGKSGYIEHVKRHWQTARGRSLTGTAATLTPPVHSRWYAADQMDWALNRHRWSTGPRGMLFVQWGHLGAEQGATADRVS